jgi:hypothetical protein
MQLNVLSLSSMKLLWAIIFQTSFLPVLEKDSMHLVKNSKYNESKSPTTEVLTCSHCSIWNVLSDFLYSFYVSLWIYMYIYIYIYIHIYTNFFYTIWNQNYSVYLHPISHDNNSRFPFLPFFFFFFLRHDLLVQTGLGLTM